MEQKIPRQQKNTPKCFKHTRPLQNLEFKKSKQSNLIKQFLSAVPYYIQTLFLHFDYHNALANDIQKEK